MSDIPFFHTGSSSLLQEGLQELEIYEEHIDFPMLEVLEQHVLRSSEPEQITPSVRSRTRVTRACDNCRERKARCDAQPGNSCSLCSVTKSSCIFSHLPQKRGPKSISKKVLERVHAIDVELNSGTLDEDKLKQFLTFVRENMTYQIERSRKSSDDDLSTMTEYRDQSVKELQRQLKTRGLKISGKKADLVRRLQENDLQKSQVSEVRETI